MSQIEALKSFINSRLEQRAVQLGANITDYDSEKDLLSSGLFDSLGFLELISAVETTFSIEVDLSGVDPEVFTTLSGFVDQCVKALSNV